MIGAIFVKMVAIPDDQIGGIEISLACFGLIYTNLGSADALRLLHRKNEITTDFFVIFFYLFVYLFIFFVSVTHRTFIIYLARYFLVGS